MYPDFLVIGAQKAGTTWLDRNLRLHPQIWLPPEKEIHFFDLPPLMPFHLLRYVPIRSVRNWSRNRMARDRGKVEAGEQTGDWYRRYYYELRSKAWYASLFTPLPSQIAGETTPRYAVLSSLGVKRVRAMMPNCRILYLLRNPIERMWSDIAMFHSAKFGHEGLHALGADEIRDFLSRSRHLANSRYLDNLGRWEAVFPSDQIFIGFHDQIREAPHELMKSIFGFLGVDASPKRLEAVLTRKINSQTYPNMPDEMGAMLAHLLFDHIKQVHARFDNPYTAAWLGQARRYLGQE